VPKCTNFGCEDEAHYHDRYHEDIWLCHKHAADYFEAFSEWLWRGTPDSLREWLEVFNRSGGTLK